MPPQAKEEAAAKQRHAAELKAQIRAAAERSRRAAEVVRSEGAAARAASAAHEALIEVRGRALNLEYPLSPCLKSSDERTLSRSLRLSLSAFGCVLCQPCVNGLKAHAWAHMALHAWSSSTADGYHVMT
jgi:hypothetical protein